MTAPAHRVLTLVQGMVRVERAQAAAYADAAPPGADAPPDAEADGWVPVDAPDRAARIAAIAAECDGEVAA